MDPIISILLLLASLEMLNQNYGKTYLCTKEKMNNEKEYKCADIVVSDDYLNIVV